jgi:hypothetical protein
MVLSNSRIIIIALAAALASACERRAPEPERALNDFASAVNERRCSDAIEFLSARTRYSLERLREKPDREHNPVPLEEYYCSKFTFEDCKLREMALKEAEDESATVSMPCGRTQDSFLPGFPSMFLKYEPRDWNLVREDDRWRIVLPFVIKIVEVREREDQLRERALREQEEFLKRRKLKEESTDR